MTTPSGYTSDEVWEQLITPGNQLRFQYELLNRDDGTIGWLKQSITSCTVSLDSQADIKRTAKFSIWENPAEPIDYLNNRIRPWIGVGMRDGGWADFPQGVFVLQSPTRHSEGALITRAVDGFDKTKLFFDASFGGTDDAVGDFTILAGSLYTDNVIQLLQQFGVTLAQIKAVESAITVNKSRKITKKTARKIVDQRRALYNKLNNYLHIKGDVYNALRKMLHNISYEDLWFDGFGYAMVQPYTDTNDKPVQHVYFTDDESIIQPGVDHTFDLTNIPNVITFVVSQTDRPPLVSRFVNNDPSSPVSIASRGRRIVYFDSNSDAATQSELDAVARQAAIAASNVYETVELPTMINPMHGYRDRVQLRHDQLDVSGDFEEIKWSIEMKAGGTMNHTLQKLININSAIVGVPSA